MQFLLEFQQLFPLRQVLAVLDQRVQVVDHHSQQCGGHDDVKAKKDFCSRVFDRQVAEANRLHVMRVMKKSGIRYYLKGKHTQSYC